MTRVLHCLASLSVGGVETSVLDMLAHFGRHGGRHEHVLCAFRGGKLEQTRLASVREAGIECHVLNRTGRYNLSFVRTLPKLIGQVRPDIVQGYNQTAALWTRLLPAHRGPRIVVHCGGVGPRAWASRLKERILLGRASGFIFNSYSTQAVWQEFLPIRCPRRVIYNGLNVDRHDNETAPPALPSSPFVLLTICRLVPIKAIEIQIRALRVLADRGWQDFQLLVVGDGPGRVTCQLLAAQLGVADAVQFVGYRPDPRVYHSQAHVYLCTSYNETFGMTLADAMLDGMVCMASRAGGPSELIQDGVSGFLLPCTAAVPQQIRSELPPIVYDHTIGELRPTRGVRPDDLADRLIDVRERFGELTGVRQAAQRRILEHFSVDRFCRNLEDFYDELTGSPACSGAVMHR